MRKNSLVLRMTAALSLCTALAAPAATGVMSVNNLSVFRDGVPADWLAGNNFLLFDGFDNGLPLTGPNFAGGAAATYTLRGLADPADAALAVRETGGKLLINPLYGATSPNAAGEGGGRSLRVRLETRTDTATGGLPETRPFAASIGLSLAALPLPGQTFGLRFTDSYNDASDVIELNIIGRANGDLIQFRKQDFLAGTITVLGQTPLVAPDGASNIVLGLSHPLADSDVIRGVWAYSNASGTLLGSGFNTFLTSAVAFRGEDHTQIELRATQLIPEPASAALLLAGLATFGVLRGKRKPSTLPV